MIALMASVGHAQAGPPEPELGPDDEIVEGSIDDVPATFSVGLHGGLPGYRYGSAIAAIRSADFGAAARLGFGSDGVSGGVQVRWYVPLPLPLPAYLATGLDLYAGNTVWHLALGAQAPLGPRLRLDLEGGMARSAAPHGPAWSPYASFGVSYAFPVGLDAISMASSAPSRSTQERAVGSASCEAPPNPGAVRAAVDAAVRSFVREAVALYGYSYRGLSYRYRVTETQLAGPSANVSLWYQGSAVERLTGHVVEAEGTGNIGLRWDGCRWVTTAIDY
jgi:hypothetical protein